VTSGHFEAVVARYHVAINHTRLAPGCFPEGKGVLVGIISHAIGGSIAAAGYGRLYSEGDNIVCRGRFDLHARAGRMSYELVKYLGPRARWSIAFHILDTFLGIPASRHAAAPVLITRAWSWEVSVTIRGADRETRTLSIDGRPISEPSTAPCSCSPGLVSV